MYHKAAKRNQMKVLNIFSGVRDMMAILLSSQRLEVYKLANDETVVFRQTVRLLMVQSLKVKAT